MENNLYSLHTSTLAEDASNEEEQLEVYESLHPHPDLQHLEVTSHQGVDFCPSWFLPANLPNMTSFILEECHNVKKISLHRLPCTGFRSLTNLYIIEFLVIRESKNHLGKWAGIATLSHKPSIGEPQHMLGTSVRDHLFKAGM
uniref:R13L1/DRL21-like LRR repeat region domain-containing protein n=1 Tax=Leersia perrieri TaxID=77586 RepID=A0A0D9XZF6_9ORYZ